MLKLDCYRPDLVPTAEELEAEHREQITWLIESGVDVLLFETMNTVREAEICSRIAHGLAFPFFVSFVCHRPETLLSGESVLEAASAVIPFHPLALVINCTHPEIISDTLESLHQNTDYPLGAYANVGNSVPEQGGTIEHILPPEAYLRYVKHWMGFGLQLVGGCCGTTPEHIDVIHDFMDHRSE
ncbi:MAG: homocysteine S-methyltransferase family protein [Calditrichota bacterium]